MKRKISLAVISLFLVSTTTFAATSAPVVIKNPNFSPVNWHATLQNGGFNLENQTGKTQYVQVAITAGEISVFTLNRSTGTFGNCKQDLNADQGPYSVVCELAPSDMLYAEIDFAKLQEATGTYQIKMEK